jgi:CheY-like chemotaxis protein
MRRTGRAGLEAVTRERPDLLLLDLNMPQLDGIQVVRQLRAAGQPREAVPHRLSC